MSAARVHPTAVLDPGVRLGSGVVIGPYVRIEGDVEIGDDCWVATGCVVGAVPEVRGLGPDDVSLGVTIGPRTVVREYSQIHRGWKERTKIGQDCMILNQCYVAHDVRIGDSVTLSSSVLLGGHVAIGAHANLGLGASVHQHRSIGVGAMIGMGSVVVRDVPSWATAYGVPARVRGANLVGLQRAGVVDERASDLDVAYRSSDVDAVTRILAELGVRQSS